ncbi:ABC transporter substrate-binding protein [Paenibacillus turicensis]|uniref:ABC transporter substrate-binding protein n=1 Tax=Paenibacillus turicensis TaxID=160487 RepID=UPI003D2CA898
MDINTNHFIHIAKMMTVPQKNEPFPITIEQLSDALCCTPRNVKFILRRLEESGFIEWMPGRGRGNISQLTLLREVEEVIEVSFQELIAKNKIKEAIEFMSSLESNEALKQRLFNSLSVKMGFHSEMETTSKHDILRLMQGRKLEKLDPAFIYTAFEAYLVGQICNTLITYDVVSSDFLPELAHNWEHNDDYTLWTFYLRKSVKFHHGRVMTAQDVKFTIQRLLEVNSSVMESFKDIQDIVVKGERVVQFQLQRPNLFFLHLLSSVNASILPYDIELNKLIGTGPFRVHELNQEVLILHAYEQYYGLRPHLDEIDIWFVANPPSNERYYEIPVENQVKLPIQGKEAKRFHYTASGCKYLLFNFHIEGIQHQLLFREALRIIFDQVAIVKELGGFRVAPADSFLPWKSKEKEWSEPSLKLAAQLLERSGYQGETINLAYKLYKDDEDAKWIKNRAAQVGLNIELQYYAQVDTTISCKVELMLESAHIVLVEEILEDDWQWGMMNYFWNTSNYLHSFLLPNQINELHSLLEQFSLLEKQARISLLAEAEQLLRKNAWLLHGYHINNTALLNQSLLGLHTSSFGFLDISKLWVKPT